MPFFRSVLLSAALVMASCQQAPAVDPVISAEETTAPTDAELRTIWCNEGGDAFCEQRLQALAEIDAEACASEGGKIEARGRARFPVCRIYYEDAGTSCQSSTDCSGKCLLPGDTEDPADAVCAEKSAMDGCFTTVENGVAEPTICID